MSEEQTDKQEPSEVTEEDVSEEEGRAEVEAEAATGQEAASETEVDMSDIDKLHQQVESLKQLLEGNADKVVRAQAEVDNLRKRTRRDIENAHKYALEKFVNGLLPVIDSMVLGINASENAEDVASLRKGIDLTLKMFLDTLEKFGVTVVDPQGEKFNPEKHEAVSVQETEDTESGIVVAVMQKGYELNGRLLRPAMVMVSR